MWIENYIPKGLECAPVGPTGFLLTEQHIRRIKEEGRDWVWIHKNRGLLRIRKHSPSASMPEKTTPPPTQAPANSTAMNTDQLLDYLDNLQPGHDIEPKEDVQKELFRAADIIKIANEQMQYILTHISKGGTLDHSQMRTLTEISDQITRSIYANHDALLSVCLIKQVDNTTYQHSINVAVLLALAGRRMGYETKQLEALALGGLLHDTGKSKVPINILNKPGRLTNSEYAIIKSHVQAGTHLIAHHHTLSKITRDAITQHHERFDGSGYPLRLKGAEISEHGRLTAIADVFDAIISKRPYHQPLNPISGLKRILSWSEHHFCTYTAHQFIRAIGLYPIGTLLRLESGLLGVVIEQNPRSLLLPVLRIVFNARKSTAVNSPYVLDLEKHPQQILGYENPEKWGINPMLHLIGGNCDSK
ncbi:metal dependent phosphohydrolase [Desulfurispirillum indicum S5]|uniref:Metal dependent phosphohydrolase n=2 Tax=Desulfurispirillum TaxID=393029 RepID=E6W6V9_DESIS|nr:metal dependent phosphohydrolase [Desulfurispirillum indicum S5]